MKLEGKGEIKNISSSTHAELETAPAQVPGAKLLQSCTILLSTSSEQCSITLAAQHLPETFCLSVTRQ